MNNKNPWELNHDEIIHICDPCTENGTFNRTMSDCKEWGKCNREAAQKKLMDYLFSTDVCIKHSHGISYRYHYECLECRGDILKSLE